jgi:hypothetical protein
MLTKQASTVIIPSFDMLGDLEGSVDGGGFGEGFQECIVSLINNG